MLPLFALITIFLVSLAALIKASDVFTDASEEIGLHFKIPPFIVGVTIVSIGTSLPELVSSIIAVASGSSEIVVGNVLGSNIANIFLVLGFAAILARKMKIDYEIASVDIPMILGSIFLLSLMIVDGDFTASEGVLLIFMYIIYVLYTINAQKKYVKDKEEKEIKQEIKEDLHPKRHINLYKQIALLVLSSVFIFIGAKYTIWSVIEISTIIKVGTEILAVTAVALGTSLPELVVSITTAKKGKSEMAIGNVLGSNIFNTLMVMGVPSFFGTLIVPMSILTFALPIVIIATILYSIMSSDKKITNWEGWILILFYLFFVGKTIGLI